MVRVLMCGPISTLGGVSTHTKYLTKNLVNNGINVILYQFDSPERYNDLIHLLLKMYRRTFGLVITGFLNRKKYDLIHTQTSGGLYSFISAVTGSIVAKIANKKLIVTFHNSAKLKLLVTKYNYIFAFVLNNVEKIILVSNTQKETLSEYFPMYSSKMIVIPNGYDSSLFFAQDMNASRRKRLYLSTEKKIIVSVGNLLEVKGHKYLIEAMAEVVKHRNDVQCYIIGGGALEKKLKKQIVSAGLEDFVTLVGAKSHSEIPIWMNACDLFVLSSLNEGNPTVMFECLGCGKPFVGTKVGGVPEIITSDDYGLLVEPGDSNDLAEKIEIALNKDWDIGKIKEYGNNFTWENIASQIVEVYDSVSKE